MNTLEARSPNCLSKRYVLKSNSRSIGEYRGRFWSESIDVRMAGGKRYAFKKESWFGNDFALLLMPEEKQIATCQKASWLTSTWNLNLTNGALQLVSKGLLSGGFDLLLTSNQDEQGEVERRGLCENGWIVRSWGNLEQTDLLFIGLIFQTILNRRRRRSSNSTATTS